MSIEYLSDEWLLRAADAVRTSDQLAALASSMTCGLTQVVTGAPSGEVAFHLALTDGRVEFGRGAAEPEQIRFTESFDDAVRLARGDVNAQELLIAGRLRFDGDHLALLAATPVIEALDAALAPVRADTTYPA